MDILALLVEKLRQNEQKLFTGIPTNSLEISYKICDLSANNLGTSNAR